MPKLTIADTLIAGLTRLGYTQVSYRHSSKYRVFSSPKLKFKDGTPALVFVGRAGALRIGRSASNSHSASGSLRDKVLAAAQDF